MREKLSDNFYRDEFACNCGCGTDSMSPDFIKKLQVARTLSGISFIINRGASCREHNKAVGGVPDSTHVPENAPDNNAHASDIQARSASHKYIILFALKDAGFTRFGIYDSFIHVDDGDTVGIKQGELIF